MKTDPLTQQQTLRQAILRQRRALSPHERISAAQDLTHTFMQTRWWQYYQHIAFYLPMAGEMDARLLLARALHLKKQCYLPALHPVKPHRLLFLRYTPDTKLIRNRYGILEPKLAGQRIFPTYALDLVLTPLVAFDDNGHRIGMGGGYYDTTFARTRKPKLVGLAYDFQKADHITPNAWDVPLHAVVTQRTVWIMGG